MAALPVHVSANVWVGIDLKNKKVAPNPIEISKAGMHEVEWYCTEKDKSLKVRFLTTSPFRDTEFNVAAGGTACSGAVTNADVNCEYEFQVYIASSAAPQLAKAGIIIIRP